MTEACDLAPRTKSQAAAIDLRELTREDLSQIWHRLKREVTTARRDPHGLAKYLTTVGSDIDIAGAIAQRAGEHSADANLVMLCTPDVHIDGSQELRPLQTP